MTKSILATVAISLSLGGAALAHDYKAGALKIDHPWSRATPGGAKVGGGYLVIENTGSAADKLVAVSAPAIAGRTEMHEMATTNGVMTMRPLDGGVEIAPGAKVEFKPGGYHIMFMELKQPLKQDERVKGTLTFEKAGTVEVEFKVEAVGARGADHGAHKGH
ncbi:copper chaperone PCu(A)C [Bosea vaviloviae]|uniref:Membrane protein n=1 Tax=Bosea vaviloviae TaxID=1526658 RepID=A0A0N0MAK5_9HYPH|nr:copper chaperone PCu(A)C [Bosea vaviloviae]KPH79771.1 membrane protein [Bosea vaviloviae]